MHSQQIKMMQNPNIQVYVTGGAVRDVMLNVVPKDVDFVVVGSTPEEMVAHGFKQVGADFPVFLAETNDEWALARTERKTSVGYKGFETEFDPSVTIEDDLRRRDLTINSMAVRIEDWESFQLTKCYSLLIDPFSGRDDLKWHVLRNTSEAFSEDPIRVLRTARFAARYNFNITQSTIQLMSEVVHELDHVPAERIWAEFEKGLMENHPEVMIEVLHEVGAFNVNIMTPYKQANPKTIESVKGFKELETRFVSIAGGFKDPDYETHRIPSSLSRMSKAVHKMGKQIVNFHKLIPIERLDIMTKLRAIQDDTFAINVFFTVHTLFDGRKDDMPSMSALMNDLRALRQIDAISIAASCKTGDEIKEKLFQERMRVMSQQ